MNVAVCLGIMMGKVSDTYPRKLAKIDVLLQETGHT